MSRELEARIRMVEDIEEIKNLQARYAYLIDTVQMEKVADQFADDFVAEYTTSTFTNKAEMAEFLKATAARNSMWAHQILMPLIEVDGDKATGTWYVFGPFTAIMPQGQVPGWFQGKYENEYVRVEGKWKISHLRYMGNFMTPYEDGWVKTPMLGQ